MATEVNEEMSRGRKCLILTGCMFNMFVAAGVMFSVNTLYVALLDGFETTRRETSLVQTVFIGVTFASGLLVGIVIRRVGIKISLMIGAGLSFVGFLIGWAATTVPYLIITIGVISGAGNSLIYISTIVFAAATFQEKRGLALALLTVGSGVGQILITLLLGRLLDVYGWRGSLLIISGLYLNVIASCLLTTSSLGAGLPFQATKREGPEEEAKDTKPWHNVFKSMFVFFAFSMSICLAVVDNIMVLFMDYMVNQGLSLETGISVLIGHNLLGLVTRLTVGVLNSNTGIHSLLLFCGSSLLLGCSLLLLRMASSITAIIVLFCLFGGERGGMIGSMFAVSIDLAGAENSAIAVGITSMLNGIMTPLCGVLIGWIFDLRRSYSLALDICGYLTIGSTCVLLVTFGTKVFLKKSKYNISPQPQQGHDNMISY